jgi:anti-anti-sigma factor
MKGFEFRKYGNAAQISFEGEILAGHAGKVQEALLISLNNADHVVVNLEKVSKIDSICAGIFNTAQQKARQLKKYLAFSDIRQEAINRLLVELSDYYMSQSTNCRLMVEVY